MEPMGKTEIEKLIEGWTQADREAIRSELMRLHFGIALVKLDDTLGTWLMSLSSAEPVPPQREAMISQRCYMPLANARLIILEPAFEMVEYTTATTLTDGKIEKRWGGREKIIAPASTYVERREHRRIVRAPRSAWRVRSLFVGAQLQFPLQADVAGDLFGPDGKFTLDSQLTPGLDVSLMVKNNTDQALPFNAVIVGREVKPVLKASLDGEAQMS